MERKEKLEKRYEFCKKSFIEIDKSLFKEYQSMAYEDLASAKKEESIRWKTTKAYQALFLMCNSLLVNRLGFYSKDHDCLLLALLYNKLIPLEILDKIPALFEKREAIFSTLDPKEAFFNGISDIRISRNNYLYLPKTLRRPKLSPENIIEEVAELIKILGTLT